MYEKKDAWRDTKWKPTIASSAKWLSCAWIARYPGWTATMFLLQIDEPTENENIYKCWLTHTSPPKTSIPPNLSLSLSFSRKLTIRARDPKPRKLTIRAGDPKPSAPIMPPTAGQRNIKKNRSSSTLKNFEGHEYVFYKPGGGWQGLSTHHDTNGEGGMAEVIHSPQKVFQ